MNGCIRERERERVCVCVREILYERESVYKGEKECITYVRQRESCVYIRESCVCVGILVGRYSY